MNVKPANGFFKNTLIFIIFLLILFAAAEKAILYSTFSVKYTDEDQCIMWLSADELLKGHVHEPCFFGQAYNSCLEGWLAAPLVACGLELYEAVPLTTILMSVLPFILLALYCYKKQEYLSAIVVLACLLGFSLDYKLVSILPRGFISGVFCFGIGYWLLLRERKHHFFWFGLFAFFGIAFNEMSFFLVFPVLLSLWLKNTRNKSFYLQGLLALLFAGSYKVFAWLFYHVFHPEYNYYVKAQFGWSMDNLMKAAESLDPWLFNDFTLIAFAFLTVPACLVAKKRFKPALIVIATMLLVFLSFGLDRVQDGSDSIFFSYSRVYVFMPLLLAVLFSFFRPLSGLSLPRACLVAVPLFIITCCHMGLQQKSLPQKIGAELALKDKHVSVMPVAEVLQRTYEYIYMCRSTGNTVFAVDCPVKETNILFVTIGIYSNNRIRTFQPEYDRRSWLFMDLLKAQPKKILLYGNFPPDRFDRPALVALRPNIRVIRKDPDWLVEYPLKKNIERTFTEDLGITLRRH